MRLLIAIAAGIVYAGICGFLCSKCQPIYRAKTGAYTGDSIVQGMPTEYNIKDIFRKFRKVDADQAFRICDIVKSLGIDAFVYQDYYNNIDRVLKAPYGYIMSALNIYIVICTFDLGNVGRVIWILINIATHIFFISKNVHTENEGMSYPYYSINDSTTVTEDIALLNDVLEKASLVARERVDTMRRLIKESTDYRTIYIVLTCIIASVTPFTI